MEEALQIALSKMNNQISMNLIALGEVLHPHKTAQFRAADLMVRKEAILLEPLAVRAQRTN